MVGEILKVYIINGVPMSGKSQFCDFCIEYLNKRGAYGISISTVSLVKAIASAVGWDGIKSPEDRKFLSDLKKILTDWNDVPYKSTVDAIMQDYTKLRNFGVSEDKILFFVHCREPEEIEKFVERLGAKTILVRREEVEGLQQSNTSDEGVFDYEYDYTIENSGDLDDLYNKAMKFIDSQLID